MAQGDRRCASWLPAWGLVAVLVAAGCSAPGGGRQSPPPQPPPEVYEVRSGDTVFGIARRFGLDYRDVARWNGLGDGDVIYPGQRLRLRGAGAPAAAAASSARQDSSPPPSRWQWPTAGKVLLGFGASPRTESGVLIAGETGQPVVAAADGEVVYAGSGLTGYGPLVIVRHGASWLTAYGHNRELLVREGERVTAGQEIARMGEGAGRGAVLHFEIRRDGMPVDPLRYLPAPRP